jgi:D-serine deaminase-like pyridoxal phosphate-dependent protein
MNRNIARMAQFFTGCNCKLRPHFKAHKTPEIARRQLEAGACTGLTCATVAEAEIASLLTDDVLIANEVVGTERCARVIQLAGRIAVTVAVDSVVGLKQLSEAAIASSVSVGVLVDINIGQNRCGISPGEPALELARLVSRTSGVRFRGIMGYEGHLVAIRNRLERKSRAREAMELLIGTARLLRSNGLQCEIVSCGGTGTYDIDSEIPGITEIQAGSYVLMDTDYGELGLPFDYALSVLGTVVSRTSNRCVADCGHKALTMDHGLPLVKGILDAKVTALNDEHAVLTVPTGCKLQVGDHVELFPSHIDPTMNLHDECYVMDGDRIINVWKITARGYAGERDVIKKASS